METPPPILKSCLEILDKLHDFHSSISTVALYSDIDNVNGQPQGTTSLRSALVHISKHIKKDTLQLMLFVKTRPLPHDTISILDHLVSSTMKFWSVLQSSLPLCQVGRHARDCALSMGRMYIYNISEFASSLKNSLLLFGVGGGDGYGDCNEEMLKMAGYVVENCDRFGNIPLDANEALALYLDNFIDLMDDVRDELQTLVNLKHDDIIDTLKVEDIKISNDDGNEDIDEDEMFFEKLMGHEQPLTENEKIVVGKVDKLISSVQILVKKIRTRILNTLSPNSKEDVKYADDIHGHLKQFEENLDDIGSACHPPQHHQSLRSYTISFSQCLGDLVELSRLRLGDQTHQDWFDLFSTNVDKQTTEILDCMPPR